MQLFAHRAKLLREKLEQDKELFGIDGDFKTHFRKNFSK